MSKTALAGGIIMLLLALLGAFGTVSLNGAVVENRLYAFLTMVIVFPLFLIVFGYVFGFVKDALIAFFKALFALAKNTG